MKVRKSEPSLFAGPNSDAPEGVFGVTDVESPRPSPRAVPPSNDEFKLRSKSSFAKSIDIAPQLNVVDADIPDLVDKVGVENIDNAVRVSREELLRVVRTAKRRAKRLTSSMMNGAEHAIALDTALTYVTTAIRDGIGLELEHDPSVEIIYSDIALLEITLDRVRQMKVPKEVKRYFLKVFIDKLADDTSSRIRSARVKTNATAQVRAMQGIVSRMSETRSKQQEQLQREAPTREKSEDRPLAGSGRATVRRKTKRRA